MTDIATVPGIDNSKLTRLVRSLLKQDGDDLKIIKAIPVVIDDGEDPNPVTLSFDELEGLIKILDTRRPLSVVLEPAQWVCLTYQLTDLEQLLQEDWRITKYSLYVNARTKTLKFTGELYHIWSIPGHSAYGQGPIRPSKSFEFNMGDFDVIQQVALSRLIAAKDEKFSVVAGTIDVSYLFKFSPEGSSFATVSH